MILRRLLPVTALVLSLAFVFGALPALAQDGQPCPTCPVSFNPPSILDPGSKGAAEIRQLFYVVVTIAAFVFVGVEGLLIFSIFRFRNRPASEAVQIHGNTKLEIAWTIVPAIILAVLLGFTLRTMATVRAQSPAGSEPLKVTVIGHQWWWEFQYPDYEIKTANQLVAPAGRPIQVDLQSFDVQHGFWVPQLFGKMDALPGHPNKMSFSVTAPGEYGGQCTQMCGEQHTMMRLSVVALSPAGFDSWVAAQQTDPAPPTAEAARQGQERFLKFCAACHTVSGTEAAGAVGPNLSHLLSRRYIAGGILALNEDNLKLWVLDAPRVKSGITMPSFACLPDGSNQTACLTPAEVNDIVAYLNTLK